jgi:hypothetical protein
MVTGWAPLAAYGSEIDPTIRYRKLTSGVYGASKEHPEEYEPWLRK